MDVVLRCGALSVAGSYRARGAGLWWFVGAGVPPSGCATTKAVRESYSRLAFGAAGSGASFGFVVQHVPSLIRLPSFRSRFPGPENKKAREAVPPGLGYRCVSSRSRPSRAEQRHRGKRSATPNNNSTSRSDALRWKVREKADGVKHWLDLFFMRAD